jgi:WD40 repeat protein/serine/threonine protein kinase
MNDPRNPASELPPSQDATVLGEDPSQLVGAVIGPYKLIEQIGEGGFGLVFVAEQHKPVRRRVALKVIKPGMDTQDVITRFEAERQALALMDHPNIARVLDAGATASGRPYFVMELVRGIPITGYCDNSRLTVRERLELFVSVCQAVQHAHQKGIIHRDIKPSNVLVTLHDGRPVVKVIDFGVAKALHQPLTEKTIYTRFSQIIGTPLYMSPEQAEMSGLDIDTRSDIYSLGVLLYELLTGSTPFDRKRLAQAAYDELIRIIRDEEPERPSTRLSHSTETLSAVAAQRKTEPARLSRMFRGDLDWITMKALEKDRTRRYETADALARDVERHLNDEPVEAGPPAAGYRLRKYAYKHRAALRITGAFLVLLVLGAIVSIGQAIRATVAEKSARASEEVAQDQRREADNARKEADQARKLAEKQRDELGVVNDNLRRVNYVADMNLARVAWGENNLARTRELLERYSPESGAPDLRGFEWHYLRRLLHAELLTFKAHAGRVTGIAFLPDGRLLTAGTEQPHHAIESKLAVGQVRLWDTKTGTALDFTLKGLGDTARTVVLSKDGSHVAAAWDDGVIRYWDQISGEPIILATSGKGAAFVMRFSPDGRHLIAVSAGDAVKGTCAVRAWDLVAHRLVVTLDKVSTARGAEFSPDGSQAALCLSKPGVVQVVDIKSGQEAYQYKPGGHYLLCAAFSPDGKHLFTIGENKIRPWNVATRDAATIWPSEIGVGMCLAFSPDGTRLAAAGVEGAVELRDSGSGKLLQTFKGHLGPIEALAFDSAGSRLASGGYDGTVHLWNTIIQSKDAPIGGFARDVNVLELSPDGRTLLTGVNTANSGFALKSVRLWDTSTMQQRHDPIETPGFVQSVEWSDDGQRVVLTDKDRTISVYDVATSAMLERQHIELGGTLETALAGDGRHYAYCAPEGPIRLRDLKTGNETQIVKGPGESVNVLALNSDGSRLASVDESGTVRIWDTATGSSTATIKLNGVYANQLRFSRDAKKLAVVGNLSRLLTGEVRIIDLQTGGQMSFKGHALNVTDCAFSPDGRRLATTSVDKTIRIWDLATGQEVLKLAGLAAWVNQIRFDAQGHRLIGASVPGRTLHTWDATPLADQAP